MFQQMSDLLEKVTIVLKLFLLFLIITHQFPHVSYLLKQKSQLLQ